MKTKRHSAIIKLIQSEEIETQEELVNKLNEQGFDITQATVSRDIKALGLVKRRGKSGATCYAIKANHDATLGAKYERVLKEAFVSMDMAQNILVIKTVPGMAMAVCAAIDAMHWREVVGSIAGDDTIMCAVRTVEETAFLMDKIKKIINN